MLQAAFGDPVFDTLRKRIRNSYHEASWVPGVIRNKPCNASPAHEPQYGTSLKQSSDRYIIETVNVQIPILQILIGRKDSCREIWTVWQFHGPIGCTLWFFNLQINSLATLSIHNCNYVLTPSKTDISYLHDSLVATSLVCY